MPAGHFTAQTQEGWITLRDPIAVVRADRAEEVGPALDALRGWQRGGCYAAGYLAYEAASGLDRALRHHAPPPGTPCLWFGIYGEAAATRIAPADGGEGFDVGPWRSREDAAAYTAKVRRIKDWIARGHTYQVNLTYQLEAAWAGNPWSYFLDLFEAQQPRHAAYLDTGEHVLCSASPELFFRQEGEALTARPMKGTAARGPCAAVDRLCIEALRGSAKDRAENVMIVDMLRNDLGRIAVPGSVRVEQPFHIEHFGTLHQMTSTVRARTPASWDQVLRAMFPCASVTGAPKVRTMELIRELETEPRGIYTGCIGWVSPRGDAEFNVAIRTAVVDRAAGRVRYGTGAGIVWDSDPETEYRECGIKAEVLRLRGSGRTLFESLLWEPGAGYFLREEHHRRMRASAEWLGLPFDPGGFEAALDAAVADAPEGACKVRLFCDPRGRFRTDRVAAAPARPVRLCLDDRPVDRADPNLYHKTTDRSRYTDAEARFPQSDEVLLWNERGEITESTRANVVVRRGGVWITPPVECGLLSGTFRMHLLASGAIREGIIQVSEWEEAEEMRLINAVRKWIPVDRRPALPATRS